MGNKALMNGSQDRLHLIRSCERVLNWLKKSHVTIQGKTYGSDTLIIDPQARGELYRYVFEQFVQLSGKTAMPFTQEEVAGIYSEARKGNFERLRDGELIRKGCHAMPLFGEGFDEEIVAATLYVYLGSNQKAGRKLIKVGYTGDDLHDYLRRLERQYAPRLMASRCGDQAEEKRLHSQWERYRAEGREWYWATDVMFSVFRRDWKTETDFEEIVAEAKRLSPF